MDEKLVVDHKTEESLIPKRHSRRGAKIGFKEISDILVGKPNHKTKRLYRCRKMTVAMSSTRFGKKFARHLFLCPKS